MKKTNKQVLLLLVLVVILVIIYYIKTVQELGMTPVADESPTPVVVSQTPSVTESVPVAASSRPIITVLSPNGGEKIELNRSTTLKWAQIDLNSDDVLSIAFRDKDWNVCWAGKIKASLGQIAFNPSEIKCSAGSTFTSFKYDNKYVLQLIADRFTDGMGVADQSDSPFTIVR